tara:strand:- start:37077 stop:37352 length:276 start_codon:yes stop_codon:yes gene_type:complete
MTDEIPLLSGLRSPDEIAKQISEATGVPVTGRTVWERAIRLGIAKKMGRTPLIHVDDIPALLVYEIPKRPTMRKGEALRLLRKARRERAKP